MFFNSLFVDWSLDININLVNVYFHCPLPLMPVLYLTVPFSQIAMAAGPIAERNQDATIYVGGLDEKVCETLLWELFLEAGPVGE